LGLAQLFSFHLDKFIYLLKDNIVSSEGGENVKSRGAPPPPRGGMGGAVAM